MAKIADPIPPRECTGCGKSYSPKRRDQKTCGSKECHNKSRSARGRSEASKASSRARDVQKTKDAVTDRIYVGWDGEGCNPQVELDDGEWVKLGHRYTYMAGYGTDGRLYELNLPEDRDFLGTEDILWFLWKNGLGKSNWFFSGKYDWTHILRDMIYDEDDLEILWQIHHPEKHRDGTERDVFSAVRWRNWGITYVQGSVTITRYFTDKGEVNLKDGEEQCGTYWTAAGEEPVRCIHPVHKVKDKKHCFPGRETGTEVFFQDAFRCFGGGSFVNMLKAWQVGTQEQRDEIAVMKDKRANFDWVNPEVKRYCIQEVTLLAEAAKKIVLTFNELGIRPTRGRWYSAGSPAKAMLRNNKIPEERDKDGNVIWEGYRGPDRWAGAPEDIQDILERSYFGGWFENAETGLFEELFSEDFKSAYPAVIRDLPCLQHGRWTHAYSEGGVNFGRISWTPKPHVKSEDIRWTPAPWRFPDNSIYRPAVGEGWYCEAEIRSMQKLPDFDIEVIEWVGFERGCDHQPFAWVQEAYDLRLEFDKAGDGTKGLVIKVTLNSVYGTFADTLQLDSRYASIVWASMITGGCRAKINDEIAWRGDQIVSIATDGIMSTVKSPRAVEDSTLGALNFEGSVKDVLLIQPGVYLAADGKDPKKQHRTRGHGLKDLKAIEPELREAWLRDGWAAEVTYERTRLIPAKLAIARKDIPAVYGQWVTEEVTVKFTPPRRDPMPDPGPHKRTTPNAVHFYKRGRDGQIIDPLSHRFDSRKSALANQSLKDEKELEDGQP